MSKGTIIFIVIMSWVLIIHGGLLYLVLKKKEYWLISGFSGRSEEEQEYLIENGYINKVGKLLLYSFYLLLLAFLLTLFNVPYGVEIGFGLLTIFIFGGTIYIQKYEVPHKRKKYFWITSSIGVAVIIFIGVLFGLGYSKNEVTIENETLNISGMYGVEWKIEDIERVELLDQLPEVEMKTNGFATSDVLKGRFHLEEPFGRGILFVEKGYSPYLYVKMENDFVILNRKDKDETIHLYETLMKFTK